MQNGTILIFITTSQYNRNCINDRIWHESKNDEFTENTQIEVYTSIYSSLFFVKNVEEIISVCNFP